MYYKVGMHCCDGCHIYSSCPDKYCCHDYAVERVARQEEFQKASVEVHSLRAENASLRAVLEAAKLTVSQLKLMSEDIAHLAYYKELDKAIQKAEASYE